VAFAKLPASDPEKFNGCTFAHFADPGRLRRFFVLRFNEVSSPNFFTTSHPDARRIVSHGCWSLSNFRGADYLPAFKHLMDARRTTTWTNWQGVIPGSINMQKSLKLLQPAFDQEKL
jgi:hypothetical protein